MMNRALNSVVLLCGLVFLFLTSAAPALAHEEHKKKPQQTEQVVPAAPGQPSTADPNAMHAQLGEKMEEMKEDRSQMSMTERLLDWIGRLHPIVVHFPIAFFPAALFAAIVGRRRPAFAAPVQFLVVAGAIIAPIAAILGWFDAMAADPDPLLTVHRWLGTAIGAAALGIGIWAWRQPERVGSTAMIVALSVMTGAIIIQGWYGGALVHGIDHLNW